MVGEFSHPSAPTAADTHAVAIDVPEDERFVGQVARSDERAG